MGAVRTWLGMKFAGAAERLLDSKTIDEGRMSPGVVEAIKELRAAIHSSEKRVMHSLDQVIAKLRDQGTIIAGIPVLVAGLRTQLADALSGQTLSPEVQNKIDTIFDEADANNAAIAAALTAGTPAEGTEQAELPDAGPTGGATASGVTSDPNAGGGSDPAAAADPDPDVVQDDAGAASDDAAATTTRKKRGT